MKYLIAIFFLFMSISVFSNENNRSEEQIIYNKWYSNRQNDVSYEDFLKDCDIRHLSIEPIIDKITAKYEDLSINDFLIDNDIKDFRESYRDASGHWHTYRGKVCTTDLVLKNDRFKVKKINSKLLIRLKKREWKTACDKILEENNQKDTMYQSEELGWTLLQGRFCYVKSFQVINEIKGEK